MRGGRGRPGQSYCKTERDGGDSLLAKTDDSRIRQQYRTTFRALKHMRSSSYTPAIHFDSALSLETSSDLHGGGLGSVGWRRQGRES